MGLPNPFSVVVPLPFAPQRSFRLPILFRLYLNKNAARLGT